MTHILLIRHGPTTWNTEHRIQGRTDIKLSDAGRDEVGRWRVPADWRDVHCYSSPLARTVETADLLGFGSPTIDSNLVETDWGQYEGQRLTDLRQQYSTQIAENEARGIDFRPPGGESPRDVSKRFIRFASQKFESPRIVGVTHKGVIRAALALAIGWDMREKSPIRLHWDCAHEFAWNNTEGLTLVNANISLLSGRV